MSNERRLRSQACNCPRGTGHSQRRQHPLTNISKDLYPVPISTRHKPQRQLTRTNHPTQHHQHDTNQHPQHHHHTTNPGTHTGTNQGSGHAPVITRTLGVNVLNHV